jgi:hypothetical protein
MKNKNFGIANGLSVDKPQAWIAVSSNRQKVYDVSTGAEKVYLEDGQEFQIELYNPTQISYVAKIYINGQSISSSGLVLKPGQRYFLDRFIDENKKLIFSTYDVENTKGAKDAIAKNGNLKVDFHAEYFQNFPWGITTAGTGSWTTYPSTLTIPANINFGDYGTYSTPVSTFTTATTGNLTYTSGMTNTYFCASAQNAGNTLGSTSISTSGSSTVRSKSADTIETGRIEKGEKSNQKFDNDNGTYNSYASFVSEYKILPRSAKPVGVSEIRSYCPGCGTRMKKQNWKFCPTCGESLD